MVPSDFPESNVILHPPEGVSSEDCTPLNVLRAELKDGQCVVVSCYKLTKEEVDELIKTGRLYLTVWGTSMPPVELSVKPWFRVVN